MTTIKDFIKCLEQNTDRFINEIHSKDNEIMKMPNATIDKLLKTKNEILSVEIEKMLPDNHVLNADLSVEENRNLVTQHNEKVILKGYERFEKLATIDSNIENAIADLLLETNPNATHEQAKLAYLTATEREGYSVLENIEYADDLIDFLIKANNLTK